MRTWAEVLHDAEHRHKYAREALGVAPEERRAVEYLRRMHADKLPEILVVEDSKAA